MGLTYNRAQVIQERLEGRMNDIFSHVKHFALTHDYLITEVRGKVFGSDEAKKLPQYRVGYLGGKYNAMRQSILEYRVAWLDNIDGTLMTRVGREVLTSAEEIIIRQITRDGVFNLQGSQYLSWDERKRRIEQGNTLAAQLHANTYKTPVQRINHDGCGYYWRNEAGVVLRDKKYL